MRRWTVCFAPEMCAPCRSNQHEHCSFDGEPDCLCKPCKRSGRAKRNRAALESELS